MDDLDTEVSLSDSRNSPRVQNSDNRQCINYGDVRGQGPAGSFNRDEDEVQDISPFSVATMGIPNHSRRLEASDSSAPLNLELTLGLPDSSSPLNLELSLRPPGMASQQASIMASRNEFINVSTDYNDDLLLPSQNRTTSGSLPEPSENRGLTCAICMDTMKEETSTVCGHVFCRLCILQAIKRHRKCPTCRQTQTWSSCSCRGVPCLLRLRCPPE
ncbi:hypothetical protein KP509_07G047800 [Ceratopteris richardii]|uniref:RING-type domain-containing protein n=1 Tax=Ceratopteris richardii TaxID=49495 RepID=A0A8T2UAP4_CERRI|nr:hypothetical protein KP509_07G047800 [Ceratopteris richardii]